MRIKAILSLFLVIQLLPFAAAHGTVSTFQYVSGNSTYRLLGGDPSQGNTTTISTLLVPVSLSFESARWSGAAGKLDATPDIGPLLRSPIFSPFAFPAGDKTQFADAMLRATFPKAADGWHTLFGKPKVMKTVSIEIPAADGYLLTSRKTGGALAVADVEYVQREVFKQVGTHADKLVIAVTRNATFYTEGDATICCSWGTHGVDSATGDSFVLASYLDRAPALVEDRDIQPLTQQLAEFINDPLHDPLIRQAGDKTPGNRFPPWMPPISGDSGEQARCGGTRAGSAYFLLEPTDNNHKNNVPKSKAFVAGSESAAYHIQNVALLRWYLGDAQDLGTANSFPDAQALSEPAKPCPVRNRPPASGAAVSPHPTTEAAPRTNAPNGHELIGYWAGYGSTGFALPAKEISPQWDVVIVAFATPDKNAAEGTLQFRLPQGLDPEQFKADVAYLKTQGRKVMISLGGGGRYFNLANPKSIPNFVSSVTHIIEQYGFDGIDIDFESPSLVIDAGDSDFKHPTTPSIVNLIAGMRQLRHHFGPNFMISLVPEGTQIPAGYRTYGGQFGSYLPIAYGIRDILSFMDVQDYNTPPLESLDGEIYQAGSVDYHAAMTELVLRGFNVGGDPKHFFSPLAPNKVAVGFLVGETTPDVVKRAMDYIIVGKRPAGTSYRMIQRSGYSGMIGAMFWTIDADHRNNYEFSNVIGPELHGYSAAK